MSHPFDARARSNCFVRAVVRFHRGFASIAQKIDEDITRRGLGGLARHPKVSEAFRLVHAVVDEMLQFEAKAAAYATKHLKVRGVCKPSDAYSEEHEAALIHWVTGALGSAPKQILTLCRRLLGTPDGLRDLADSVLCEAKQRIRRDYSESRAEYELEQEAIRREHATQEEQALASELQTSSNTDPRKPETPEDNVLFRPAEQVRELFKFPSHGALQKFLVDHPDVRTKRPKTKTGKEDPHRKLVHIGELAQAVARASRTIDPRDLLAGEVDEVVAEVERGKAEVDARRKTNRK